MATSARLAPGVERRDDALAERTVRTEACHRWKRLARGLEHLEMRFNKGQKRIHTPIAVRRALAWTIALSQHSQKQPAEAEPSRLGVASWRFQTKRVGALDDPAASENIVRSATLRVASLSSWWSRPGTDPKPVNKGT
jgi:predicted DNA-binding protein